MKLTFPARTLMTKTNDEDPIDYYYHPLTSWAYCQRLEIALNMLGFGPYEKILEVGYGSGILLPELALRCQELHAVDIHEIIEPVSRMLRAEKISAVLKTGDILNLPYSPHEFNAVVCLSVLEHIEPDKLPIAFQEIYRTLKPGGIAILGFPVRNILTDNFYKVVGCKPRDIHPSSHQDIIRVASRSFTNVDLLWWPRAINLDYSLYAVCKCTT